MPQEDNFVMGLGSSLNPNKKKKIRRQEEDDPFEMA